METTTDTKCPTCGAEGEAKCVTVLYVRQADGSYAPVNRPTRRHKNRK